MKKKLWQHIVLLKPQAFLFDWDGTLVKFRPQIFLDGFNFTMTKLGFSQSTLLQDLSQSQSIRHSFEERIKCSQKRQEAYSLFQNTVASYGIAESDVMPGARELVTAIKTSKIPMGIVSNLDQSLVKQQVSALKFTEFKVITGTDYRRPIKPHPAPIQESCKALGFRPNKRVFMVGDTKTDIACAHNSGCSSVLVSSLPNNSEIMSDFAFNNLQQLITYFNIQKEKSYELI